MKTIGTTFFSDDDNRDIIYLNTLECLFLLYPFTERLFLVISGVPDI